MQCINKELEENGVSSGCHFLICIFSYFLIFPHSTAWYTSTLNLFAASPWVLPQIWR